MAFPTTRAVVRRCAARASRPPSARRLALERLEARDLLSLGSLLSTVPGVLANQQNLYSGYAVPIAADGNLAIVGESDASAAVLDLNAGTVIATLRPPSPSVATFGYSVALSGPTAVVGSLGAAFVFDARSGSLLQTLTDPNPVDPKLMTNTFGNSVAINGRTVVVGAPTDGMPGLWEGYAYLFDSVTGGLVASIRNPVPADGAAFGASVAVSGASLVVGAPGEGANGNGVAFVLDSATGSLVRTLAPNARENGFFGRPVAISGDTAAVGEPYSGSGIVYVFDAVTGDVLERLTGPAGAQDFGLSVAVRGDTIAVGAPNGSLPGVFGNPGIIRLFEAATGTLRATIADPVQGASSIGDGFGEGVALADGVAVATGLNAAYVFQAAPAVAGVWTNLTEVSDRNVGDQFWVRVHYDTPMLYASTPTISFSPDAAGTLKWDSGTWTTQTDYMAFYDVADANVDLGSIAVTVDGATDAYGWPQTPYSQGDLFSIDTLHAPPPLANVVHVTMPNLTEITDSAVGTAKFVVRVEYDQPMNLGPSPVISFTPDVPNTLLYNAVQSCWGSDRVFYARYDVMDAGAVVPSVGISVAGARDAIGNLQAPYSETGDFSIDTLSATPTPATVFGVTASVPLVTDVNVGPAQFELQIEYDQPMNSFSTPQFTFSPSVSSTLVFNAGASAWESGTVFDAWFDVRDANVRASSVSVTVSGAVGATGILEASGSVLNLFGVDTWTAPPRVLSVTPSAEPVTANILGGAAFCLRIEYGQWMNEASTPTIAFTPDVSSTLHYNAVASGWTSNSVFEAWYDVADADAAVPAVGVGVTSAYIGTGTRGQPIHVQMPYSGTNVFSIDTLDPPPPPAHVVGVTTSLATVTQNDPDWPAVTVRIEYDEAMNTGTTPQLSFTPDVSTSLEPNASASYWEGDRVFYAGFDASYLGVVEPSVDIRVEMAHDASGPLQVPYNALDVFGIDTLDDPPPPSILGLAGDTGSSNTDKITTDPTLNLKCVVPGATVQYSFDGGATWTVTDAPPLAGARASVSVRVRQIDAAQKASPASRPFSYTLDVPAIASEYPNLTTITTASVGPDAFFVTVFYNEAMDQSVANLPAVSFMDPNTGLPLDLGSTLAPDWSGWLTSTRFEALYNITNAGVYVPHVGIAVVGGIDLAGNSPAVFQGTDDFSINTHDPTPPVANVTRLARNMTAVTEGQVGSRFELDIVYDEDMDTRSAPTITFLDSLGQPNTRVGATVFENYAASLWFGERSYMAWFDIQNPYDPSGIMIRNIGVKVEGGRDAAGRTPNAYTESSVFDVDTLVPDAAHLPSIANVSTNAAVITDAQAGADKFMVRIDYDRPMWGGLVPIITFVPDPGTPANVTGLANTLSFDADSSGWGNYDPASHGYSTFWAWYNVSEAGASIPSVAIKIKGTVDMSANPQSWFERDAAFSIDMRDDASPYVNAGRMSNPSHVDAAIGSGLSSLPTAIPIVPASQAGGLLSKDPKSPDLTAADYALLYSGTWLEA